MGYFPAVVVSLYGVFYSGNDPSQSRIIWLAIFTISLSGMIDSTIGAWVRRRQFKRLEERVAKLESKNPEN